MATYNTELLRKGPGLLLRDILSKKDPQVQAVIATIAAANPDIIALQGVDYDLEGRALEALRSALQENGISYPHAFAAPPNAGLRSGLDLDGDGKLAGPGDAQGYGAFLGQGAMALLSKYPVVSDAVEDFSAELWQDQPGDIMPVVDGLPFPSAEAQLKQRLFSHGGWVVPVRHPKYGLIRIITFHATPPVFDGPEDRNGRRNNDEVMFWHRYLSDPERAKRAVIAADANLDPKRGDGRREAMGQLLAHPALQDPLPGAPTVTWAQTGPMRVDYVLPSTDWRILGAGMTPENATASRHNLVWVDLMPRAP